MDTIVSNLLTNLSAGQIWQVILIIIPFICSVTGVCIGLNLIWRLLNWKFDTKIHKRYAKRAFRSF